MVAHMYVYLHVCPSGVVGVLSLPPTQLSAPPLPPHPLCSWGAAQGGGGRGQVPRVVARAGSWLGLPPHPMLGRVLQALLSKVVYCLMYSVCKYVWTIQ